MIFFVAIEPDTVNTMCCRFISMHVVREAVSWALFCNYMYKDVTNGLSPSWTWCCAHTHV